MTWIDAASALTVLVASLTVAFGAAALITSRAWRIEDERDSYISDEQPGKKNKVLEFVRTRIEGSGVPVTASEFCFIWLACAAAPFLAGLLLGVPTALTLLLTAAGLAAPWLWVNIVRSRSKKRFAEDLGHVLPLVAANLRGGLSIRQALIPVADNLEDPIRGEFQRLAAELDQGVPIEQALAAMAERNDNKDLVLLASGVATQAETGGNLADIIESIGETIRVRTELRKTITSKTSQQRATANFLLLFPAIMLVVFCLMSEVFREFYLSPAGFAVILVCVVIEVIGYAVVHKIADIRID